jgi:secretion/DNA translocation related CpaE-like protein
VWGMNPPSTILAVLSTVRLRDEVERIAAAADVGVVHAAGAIAPMRRTWLAADAVVLDEHAARVCAAAATPRRSAVFVVGPVPDPAGPTSAQTLEAAIAVGAGGAYQLPGQSAELVAALSAVGDMAGGPGGGSVVAVLGGRGGAGASLFAAGLALTAAPALLVDLDSWGGGIDLLLGAEAVAGLRWPDIAVQGGRLDWPTVRAALPSHRDVSVLSAGRHAHPLTPSAVDAVLDAGRRAGLPVICDLPRHLSDVTSEVIAGADLVVLIAVCDVRACAATAATAAVVTAMNPSAGLVVRGPAPGGLRAHDVAASVGLPLLATMRPEPLIAEKLERGGLRPGRRSPLSEAAAQVLDLLQSRPAAVGIGA